MNELRLEYVIVVEGTVRARPAESVNEKMKTGVIEVLFSISIVIFASSC